MRTTPNPSAHSALSAQERFKARVMAGLDKHDKHEDGEDIEEESSVGTHVVHIDVRSGKET